MKRSHTVSLPGFGGSALLVIFGVLCLSVFAMLSLSTVQAQKRLSDASADAVTAYYRADCQAEIIYAQLRRGDIPAGVTENNGEYQYCCPISSGQQLTVTVKQETGTWTVLRWQAESIPPVLSEDPLPLWNGYEGGNP